MKTSSSISITIVGLLIATMLIVTANPTKAQSTVLFSENFTGLPNGSQPAGWTHDPNYSIQNGTYASVGSHGYSTAYYTGASFSNFTYQATVSGLGKCNQQPPVFLLNFRMQNRLNGYSFAADIDKLQIWRWVNGNPTFYGYKEIGQITPTGTYNMSVTVSGSSITATFNGQSISVTDTTFSSGYIGVATYNCNAAFNDIIVSSLDPTTTIVLTTTTNSTTTSSTSTTSLNSTSTTTTTSTLANSTSTTSTTSVSTTTVPTTTVTETCQVVFTMSGDEVIGAQIGECD